MDKTVHEPDRLDAAFQNFDPVDYLIDKILQDFVVQVKGHLDIIDVFLRNDPLSDQERRRLPDEFQVGQIVLVARGLAGFDLFFISGDLIHKIPFLLCEFFFRHGIGIIKIKIRQPINRGLALVKFAFQNGKLFGRRVIVVAV